jgi:hypothetical protein
MSLLSKIGHMMSSVVQHIEHPEPAAAPPATPAPTGMSGASSYSPYQQPPVALTPPTIKPVEASNDPGEQRIQNTMRALSRYEMNERSADGQSTDPLSLELATANLANQLAHDPNGRQRLAEIGQGQLGFDPMHNRDRAVDSFLDGISDELNLRAAACEVPATVAYPNN